MSAKNSVEQSNEIIKDDLTKDLDTDKLAALKAKMAAKIVVKKERSIAFGVVGSGQAGSRISQAFFQLGYDAIAINTASQDLKYIEIPESNKLLLQYAALQGAAKDLSIGKAAAEANRDAIAELIEKKLSNSQLNILCLSLGGGSGAGSCETLVEILGATGKPLVVITALPMDNEDAQTKSNALQTLSKLAKAAQNKQIANLIVVDNARIEAIYHDVGQLEFFTVANKAIVDTIDMFNVLSSTPSSFKALDSMEFAKLFTDGEGLTVYGEMTVKDYQEDTAIAEAIVSNLNGNLLAQGFDLKQAKYVGVLIVANKEVWAKIPSASVNYAMSMVNDFCSGPKGTFKGIYTGDSPDDSVKIYSMFSGLSLPDSRIEQLKKEASESLKASKEKDQKRNLSLSIDTGTEQTVSDAQRIKDKIAAKASAFGKLMGPVDRRGK